MSGAKHDSKLRPFSIHPVDKRIHAVRGAYNALAYMVRLVEEEPEFFKTDDGQEYLESVKTRHLPALLAEINFLRESLPPEEL